LNDNLIIFTKEFKVLNLNQELELINSIENFLIDEIEYIDSDKKNGLLVYARNGTIY
jgi:hypothetical protein